MEAVFDGDQGPEGAVAPHVDPLFIKIKLPLCIIKHHAMGKWRYSSIKLKLCTRRKRIISFSGRLLISPNKILVPCDR
jgi:hypothetical protein